MREFLPESSPGNHIPSCELQFYFVKKIDFENTEISSVFFAPSPTRILEDLSLNIVLVLLYLLFVRLVPAAKLKKTTNQKPNQTAPRQFP